VSDLRLATEFRDHPFGCHSLELQALLDLMRSQPIAGKHFLFMSKTQEQWILGRFSIEIPVRPVLDWTTVFTDIRDAEWHVFEVRWNDLYGSDLNI